MFHYYGLSRTTTGGAGLSLGQACILTTSDEHRVTGHRHQMAMRTRRWVARLDDRPVAPEALGVDNGPASPERKSRRFAIFLTPVREFCGCPCDLPHTPWLRVFRTRWLAQFEADVAFAGPGIEIRRERLIVEEASRGSKQSVRKLSAQAKLLACGLSPEWSKELMYLDVELGEPPHAERSTELKPEGPRNVVHSNISEVSEQGFSAVSLVDV